LGADAPLPAQGRTDTKLVIGDPTTQRALELSGEVAKLSFTVEWADISDGPRTIEAFRAGALDVGSVADIPPIHVTWTGLDVRIVAARFRQDPIRHPIYQLGIAPGPKIASLDDLRAKKIACSPGQAQGPLVLRVLQKAGLSKRTSSSSSCGPVRGAAGTERCRQEHALSGARRSRPRYCRVRPDQRAEKSSVVFQDARLLP
jgi:sulfonate transport system substrate-binding protein